MKWIKKIDEHMVLDKKIIRGYPVINVNSDSKRCNFYIRKDKKYLSIELGTPEAILYLNNKETNLFALEAVSEYALEYFRIIKFNNKWYAYTDDYDKMYYIGKPEKLNFDYIEKVFNILCDVRNKTKNK